MYPILSRFGPFFIYSFTIVSGLSILLGIALMLWFERKDRLIVTGWLDGVIVALVGGIAGGRTVFVLINWPYYKQNVEEIFMLSKGGLNYHGTVLIGIFALWLWSVGQRREFGLYAGLMAIPMAAASVLGWLACWLDGCAYGRLADFGPLTADLPDSFGVFGLRYQTQVIGLVLCLLVTVVILLLRRRMKPLQLFWITLLLLSVVHLIVSFYRGDSAPSVGEFRLDSLVDAGVILVSLMAFSYASITSWRKRKPAGVPSG